MKGGEEKKMPTTREVMGINSAKSRWSKTQTSSTRHTRWWMRESRISTSRTAPL